MTQALAIYSPYIDTVLFASDGRLSRSDGIIIQEDSVKWIKFKHFILLFSGLEHRLSLIKNDSSNCFNTLNPDFADEREELISLLITHHKNHPTYDGNLESDGRYDSNFIIITKNNNIIKINACWERDEMATLLKGKENVSIQATGEPFFVLRLIVQALFRDNPERIKSIEEIEKVMNNAMEIVSRHYVSCNNRIKIYSSKDIFNDSSSE